MSVGAFEDVMEGGCVGVVDGVSVGDAVGDNVILVTSAFAGGDVGLEVYCVGANVGV